MKYDNFSNKQLEYTRALVKAEIFGDRSLLDKLLKQKHLIKPREVNKSYNGTDNNTI